MQDTKLLNKIDNDIKSDLIEMGLSFNSFTYRKADNYNNNDELYKYKYISFSAIAVNEGHYLTKKEFASVENFAKDMQEKYKDCYKVKVSKSIGQAEIIFENT